MSEIEDTRRGGHGNDADLIVELEAANASAAAVSPRRRAGAARASCRRRMRARRLRSGCAPPSSRRARTRPAAAARPPREKGPAALKSQPNRPARAQQGSARGGETIRVAVDTIERIMQLVSELVLNRNQLLEITRNRENDPIKPPLQRLSGLTTDLQDAVMRARMQPVGRLFSSLPRLMRELSAELNKKINLVTDGADTELDRQLIEVLRDPLTHLHPQLRRSRHRDA